MRKGFQWTVNMLMAILLLIFTIMIFWSVMTPNTSAQRGEVKKDVVECMSSADCAESSRGSACMMIYPDNYEAFCGCSVNEDCAGKRSGVCGYDNRCA